MQGLTPYISGLANAGGLIQSGLMKTRPLLLLVLSSWLLTGTATLHALTLPRIFTDHMVLQRDLPVNLWGWAEPGQTVKVTFAGQNVEARAGEDGAWKATLRPLNASAESRELIVTAGDDRFVLKDVLVGEVWICSGQSNMEWTLNATHKSKEAIAAADLPLLRQFKVPHVTHPRPQKDLPGDWSVCSPSTAAQFTAVGFYFGLDLLEVLDVPIGLVNISWGGTRIEPWTSLSGFNVSPKLQPVLDQIAQAEKQYRENVAGRLGDIEGWVEASRGALASGADIPEFPGSLPEHPLKNAGRPTSIHNAMVAPLVPYTFRGAIWYQGESNNGEGMLYYEKMRALIQSWRALWGQGEFPFLFVQLAPYRYNNPEALPGIWEAQLASLSIPNTGMAVITDVGNVSDIHPRNKEAVGKRLALWARAKTYGDRALTYSGPLYRSMKVEGSQAILSFDHAKGLKSLDGEALTWFTIAGEDRNFVKAVAEIRGDTVVVRSDAVPDPKAVRFGWHETAEPNLVNGASLPSSPFRTDSW